MNVSSIFLQPFPKIQPNFVHRSSPYRSYSAKNSQTCTPWNKTSLAIIQLEKLLFYACSSVYEYRFLTLSCASKVSWISMKAKRKSINIFKEAFQAVFEISKRLFNCDFQKLGSPVKYRARTWFCSNSEFRRALWKLVLSVWSKMMFNLIEKWTKELYFLEVCTLFWCFLEWFVLHTRGPTSLKKIHG